MEENIMSELLNFDLGLMEDEKFLNYTGETEEELKSEFLEIPDGEYIASIQKVESKLSKKNIPYINFMLKIEQGVFTGQYLFAPFYFSPKTKALNAMRIKRLLYTLGHQDVDQYFTSTNNLNEYLNTMTVGANVIVQQETKKDFKEYHIQGTFN